MRTNKITLLLGNRNTGKTVYAKKIMQTALQADKAVLVVDTYDHPAYNGVERIKPSEIRKCKRGNIYRCFGSETDLIFNACTDFYNGLLVFEDATKYIENTITDDVKKVLFDSKQKNVDVLLMFHSWVACPPKLFRIADNIVIKKTGDSAEVRKNDCPNFQEVMKVYEEVEKSNDRYIAKFVKLQ